jgi:hypothetical protein
MFSGMTTNANGQLVATNSGLSDLSNISSLSRVLGAKPLDEAILTDALRRQTALQLKDRARLGNLGEAAMTSLYGGNTLAPQQLESMMAQYVKAGGNQDNFNGWYLDQVKKANSSVVNRSMENFHNPRSRMLQTMMGGVPLPDFSNAGSTAASYADTLNQSSE